VSVNGIFDLPRSVKDVRFQPRRRSFAWAAISARLWVRALNDHVSRQAEIQKAYRDCKRGCPPRAYRAKVLVENTVALKVQQLANHAYHQHTTAWIEPTPFGNVPIRVFSVDNPHWLEVGGIKFRLAKWCQELNCGT